MTSAADKTLLNEQSLRHKIPVAPLSSSFSSPFNGAIAHRALATSEGWLQIFLSCANLHHPLIFRYTLYGQCVLCMKGMFCLVADMTGGYAKNIGLCFLVSDGHQFVKLLTAWNEVRLNERVASRLVSGWPAAWCFDELSKLVDRAFPSGCQHYSTISFCPFHVGCSHRK